MKMIPPFFFGTIVGFIFLSFVFNVILYPEREMVYKALEDCERSLPRNEHCYIIAVPPSKD
jgi:hypothetical protein